MRKKDNGMENELALFERARNGDLAARNILAEKNITLVKKIYFKEKSRLLNFAANPLLDIDDILQEGYLGLLDALKKYDFDKYRVKFKTYANHRIIGSILDARRSSLFISRSVIEDLIKIFNAEKELEEKITTNPSIEDIAKHLNWNIAKVEKILLYAKYRLPFLSFNLPTEEDNINSLPSNLISDAADSPLHKLEEKELKEKISLILSSDILSKKEKTCIELTFGLNGNEHHTLKNIGIRFGLSEARMSQILAKALKKLRNNKKAVEILKE